MNSSILMPSSLDEALQALAVEPSALPVAGGTDLMPRVNAGTLQPTRLLGLSAIPELRGWRYDDGRAVLGATTTWARAAAPDLAALLPVLAEAAREAGPTQIRNAATLGGNIGAPGGQGDVLAVLAALEAAIVCQSVNGVREFAAHTLNGPPVVRPGELVTAVRVPLIRGPQAYLKLTLTGGSPLTVVFVADPAARTVRCAIGGARPGTGGAVRATAAEAWLATRIDGAGSGPRDPWEAAEFGRLVADEVRPEGAQRADRVYRSRVLAAGVRRAFEAAYAHGGGGA